MAVTHGARVEVMLSLADDFAHDAEQLQGIHSSATTAVHGLRSAWDGPDAERFQHDWTTHEPALGAGIQQLRTMAQVIRQQAHQQHAASGAGVGAGGGTAAFPLGPTPSPSPGPSPVPPSTPPGSPGPGGGGGASSWGYSGAMEGTQGRPEDKTMWKLAWYAYGNDNHLYHQPILTTEQPPLPKGWTVENEVNDPTTGFQSTVFRDENGNYVLAFRGSDENLDWANNFQQGAGLESRQYDQAIALAREVESEHPGQVVMTGHSLGGGLAAAAALATGATAVTFDAAGVSAHTAAEAAALRGGGMTGSDVLANAGNGQIRAYSMASDILTNVQTLTPAPDAPGTHITMPVQPTAEAVGVTAVGMFGGGLLGAAGGGYEGYTLGSHLGADIGSTLGFGNPLASYAGAALGGQIGLAEGVANGAVLGDVLGPTVIPGAYGHHWHSMDAAMEARYPG